MLIHAVSFFAGNIPPYLAESIGPVHVVYSASNHPRMKYKSIAVFFLVASGLMLASGRQALAGTYGTNFESFTLGDVNGQDGWMSGHGSSFCPVYDVDVVSNTYGFLGFGFKSLRISNAITCGSFNDQTFSKSLTDEAGETSAPTSAFSGGTRQPYFEAQWDFASTVPGSEQPGLSVVASADRGDTMRMSWLQMQDTPTGLQLNFEDYQHSILDFVTTPIATGLDRTVPHTVKVTMQFIDGPSNDIVKVYLDGVLIHTGTTWEDYFRDFAGGVPFAVDSMMFRLAGTAAPANMGNGFLIDNFTSFSGPVPAPPSAAAFTVSENPSPVFSTLIPDQAYVIKDNVNYKLYYAGNDFASIDLAQSTDGIHWTPYAGNPLFAEGPSVQAEHADVHFYSAGFTGANSGANPSALTMYYRMWYQGAASGIGGWRYAESPDGISWYNHLAVIQHGTPVFSGATGAAYGIADVVYTPGGEGGDANKTFRIYANVQWELGSYGGKELVVMAYSANGYDWTGYDPTSAGYATPVFAGTLHSGDFDSDHIGWFKVIKNSDSDWEAFYSGGTDTTYQALNGIGYATSNDGINWTRKQTLFTTADSVPWRKQSVWMPSVVKTGINTYQLWFLGSDNPNISASDWIQWKLGEADLVKTSSPVIIPPGSMGSVAPNINVRTAVSPMVLPVGPGSVTYTYMVSNPGRVPMTDVTLTDDTCANVKYVSGDTDGNSQLDITETWTYTCTTTLTKTTVNYATARGIANDIAAVDTAITEVMVGESVVPPMIHVVKRAEPASLPTGGGMVTYTYTVTNPGMIPLDDVHVMDIACSPMTLVSGDMNRNGSLDANETWTFTCATNVPRTTTGEAVATGHAGDMMTVDTTRVTITVAGSPLPPLIHIMKRAEPALLPLGGGPVTYTYTVTNPGTVLLSGVSVTDDACSPVIADSPDANGEEPMETDETWTYTCRQSLDKTTTNIATAKGSANGLTATDVSVAKVVISTAAFELVTPTSTPPVPVEDKAEDDAEITASRVTTLMSLDIHIHELMKLPDDGNPSTQADSVVYYVGADGQRHAFPNSEVYFSWYCDFSKVNLVSADVLAQIPLGKNVVYRPGIRLVKFPTRPYVYLVQAQGSLRPLTDEAAALAIAGPDWNKKIEDIDESFFRDYTIGVPITADEASQLDTLLFTHEYPSAEMDILGYVDPGMETSPVCPVHPVPVPGPVPSRWPFASIPKAFSFTHALDQTSAPSLDIRYLQIVLSFLGPSIYPEARVTGNYGSATTAAVKKFQDVHGLTVNGIVGPGTRQALNAILGKYR